MGPQIYTNSKFTASIRNNFTLVSKNAYQMLCWLCWRIWFLSWELRAHYLNCLPSNFWYFLPFSEYLFPVCELVATRLCSVFHRWKTLSSRTCCDFSRHPTPFPCRHESILSNLLSLNLLRLLANQQNKNLNRAPLQGIALENINFVHAYRNSQRMKEGVLKVQA